MNRKICLLVDSLSDGGAEKVAANMSISLSKNGYDVFIVTMQDAISYNYQGTLYNFGKIKKKQNKILAFYALKRFFKSQKFSVIIDHRVRNLFFKELALSLLVFRKEKVIYCIHNYRLFYSFSFTNYSGLAKLPHVKNRIFVAVSKGIKQHLKEKLNLESIVIYNFFQKDERHVINEKESSMGNYIIGVGRLTKIKQFNKLIISYRQSNLPENNIKLILLGDGTEKNSLQNLISDLNLNQDVNLIPFDKNPYYLMANAKALVLSSKVEGFPMVILEALTLKTPVIAFNCKSGPSEIIVNDVNGILVENQSEKQLTLALNRLLSDSFYENLKANSQKGLERFSEEAVIQDWIDLLENHK